MSVIVDLKLIVNLELIVNLNLFVNLNDSWWLFMNDLMMFLGFDDGQTYVRTYNASW